MTTETQKPRRGHKPRLTSLAAHALAHLADNGAQPTEAMRDFMLSIGSEASRQNVMSKLRNEGKIVTKVWLTPAGLDELKAMGWTPDMAGVVSDEATP